MSRIFSGILLLLLLMSKLFEQKKEFEEIKASWLGSSQDSKHDIFILLQNSWPPGNSYHKCALVDADC